MIARLKVLFYALIARFPRHAKCQHTKWRPAISNHAPAKWCAECGVTANITEGEFYSLFDRPSYATSETLRP